MQNLQRKTSCLGEEVGSTTVESTTLTVLDKDETEMSSSTEQNISSLGNNSFSVLTFVCQDIDDGNQLAKNIL